MSLDAADADWLSSVVTRTRQRIKQQRYIYPSVPLTGALFNSGLPGLAQVHTMVCVCVLTIDLAELSLGVSDTNASKLVDARTD